MILWPRKADSTPPRIIRVRKRVYDVEDLDDTDHKNGRLPPWNFLARFRRGGVCSWWSLSRRRGCGAGFLSNGLLAPLAAASSNPFLEGILNTLWRRFKNSYLTLYFATTNNCNNSCMTSSVTQKCFYTLKESKLGDNSTLRAFGEVAFYKPEVSAARRFAALVPRSSFLVPCWPHSSGIGEGWRHQLQHFISSKASSQPCTVARK